MSNATWQYADRNSLEEYAGRTETGRLSVGLSMQRNGTWRLSWPFGYVAVVRQARPSQRAQLRRLLDVERGRADISTIYEDYGLTPSGKFR